MAAQQTEEAGKAIPTFKVSLIKLITQYGTKLSSWYTSELPATQQG